MQFRSSLVTLRAAGTIPLLAAALVAAASFARPAAAETPAIDGAPLAKELLLHGFAPGSADGLMPAGAPLFVGPNAMYLTTSSGGKYSLGTIVRLVRGADAWREEVIYSFGGAGNGYGPSAGLIADRFGALYGTTENGGAGRGAGSVFKLTPVGGTWKETTLHTFDTQDNDGALPAGSLIADAAGDLFGTTRVGGGAYGQGLAFKFVPPKTPGGVWGEYALHNFTGGADGGQSESTLVADGLGNLYGTASAGGKNTALAAGTVFRLAPEKNSLSRYTFTTLHEFAGQPNDGSSPAAGVILGPGGILYGTTMDGGPGFDGTVFELVPPVKAGGAYTSYVLHGFGTSRDDTQFPLGGVVRDAYGNLYGAGNTGVGPTAGGAVYEIVL
jgi:uncharacterized repeat protein (TIGR03803 family)